MKTRRKFTSKEKAQIVLEILKEQKTMAQLATEYEIHTNQLQRWKSEAFENMHLVFSKEGSEIDKLQKKHDFRVEELTQQIGQLSIENNWLKKNLVSSNSVEERLELVDKKNPDISIKRQAELLAVNRTSVYYKPVDLSKKDIEAMHAIDRIYTRWPAFGYRRITVKLKEQGFQINRKHVLRLMQKMVIAGIYPGPNLSKRNKAHHVYPYLLRNLDINHVDQVWSIDITYIPMKEGFMYLFAVIDWYSRYIVAWEISNTLDTNFIIRCLTKAFFRELRTG